MTGQRSLSIDRRDGRAAMVRPSKLGRLRSRGEFDRVFSSGKYFAHPLLVLHLVPNAGDGRRVGYTVSRRAGTAVKRNRAKRILREAYWSLEDRLPKDLDIVLVGRQATPLSTAGEVTKALEELARRAGILSRGVGGNAPQPSR